MDLKLISREPLRMTVHFNPDEPCFREHFPDRPMVPGSLVIGLFLAAIAHFNGRSEQLLIKRFTFSRPAAPGAYELSITDSDSAFLCNLTQDDTLFAQGWISG